MYGTILKQISRGFWKKLQKFGSIGPFLYQNGRQSQKSGSKNSKLLLWWTETSWKIVLTCMLGILLESLFNCLKFCYTIICSEMQQWFTIKFFLQQARKKDWRLIELWPLNFLIHLSLLRAQISYLTGHGPFWLAWVVKKTF